MDLTLDSSVIIAALRKQETMHSDCKALLQQVKEGKHRALESVIVPVEVAAIMLFLVVVLFNMILDTKT